MPKQIKQTVYTIDELSPTTQQKLLDRYIETLPDWWHDGTLEDCTEMLETEGFPHADIGYTGFGSQGGGASFTSDVDVYTLYPRYCEECGSRRLSPKQLEYLLNYVTIEIIRDTHRYSHEHTCSVYWSMLSGFKSRPRLEKALDAFVAWLEDLRLSLCCQIYKDLEKEYDYITSMEYVMQQARDDESWFFADGREYDEN